MPRRPGVGSPQSLSMETVKNAAGLDLTHIPYKGGGQAIGDVVSGQVKVGVLGMAPALPYIKSGKLEALASPAASAPPCCPTCRRWRKPPCRASRPHNGRACPPLPGTPPAVIQRMHDELVRIMNTPKVIERLAAIGMDNATSATPDDFTRMIAAELPALAGRGQARRHPAGMSLGHAPNKYLAGPRASRPASSSSTR